MHAIGTVMAGYQEVHRLRKALRGAVNRCISRCRYLPYHADLLTYQRHNARVPIVLRKQEILKPHIAISPMYKIYTKSRSRQPRTACTRSHHSTSLRAICLISNSYIRGKRPARTPHASPIASRGSRSSCKPHARRTTIKDVSYNHAC